jgi:hypothetical protein
MAEASSDPAVSIVIVAHSVRNELERCLGSIRDFAELSVQTILVDNASTDGTVPWVCRYFPPGGDDRAVEEHRHNRPRSRAAAAHGRFTLFLDSDASPDGGCTSGDGRGNGPQPGMGPDRPTTGRRRRKLSAFVSPLSANRCSRSSAGPPLSAFWEDSAMVRSYLMTDVDHSRPRQIIYALGACELFRTSLGRSVARGGAPSEGIFFSPTMSTGAPGCAMRAVRSSTSRARP